MNDTLLPLKPVEQMTRGDRAVHFLRALLKNDTSLRAGEIADGLQIPVNVLEALLSGQGEMSEQVVERIEQWLSSRAVGLEREAD